MGFRTLGRDFLAFLLFHASGAFAQQPPYSGTIFNFPDSFADSDPSTLAGVTYVGQQRKSVYDRRTDGYVSINAYVYSAAFSDSAAPWSIMVNPEFSQDSAKALAGKYARNIGQMPICIRAGLSGAVIHAGVNPWGGGNPLTIHHGQGLAYERQGIVTETMIHESTHGVFDPKFYTADWAAAAKADGNYISTYARDNPQTEDHSETFLCWLAIRYKRERIPASDYAKITATVPNRIKWYDGKNLKLSPLTAATGILAREGRPPASGPSVRPSPGYGLRIYDLRGRLLGSPLQAGPALPFRF